MEASGAIALCHDSKHEKAVRDVLADKHFVQLDKRADTSTNECSTTIQAIQIPWSTIVEIKDLSSQYDASISLDKPHSPGQNDQVVYYRHSSGTYSGLPKLIPYTHYSAISVLPRLQHVYATGAQIVGTLSTTPLYHGGLADLWRCWSAASPLWIFPEDKAPIFGKTVLAWTQAIEKVCEDARVNSVYRGGYVSCVPYVLQMMIDETKMRDGLKRMDMVGVGGAEMPAKLGDELVAEGINLVSRFGNAECGCKPYNNSRSRLSLNRGQSCYLQIALMRTTRSGSICVYRPTWIQSTSRSMVPLTLSLSLLRNGLFW